MMLVVKVYAFGHIQGLCFCFFKVSRFYFLGIGSVSDPTYLQDVCFLFFGFHWLGSPLVVVLDIDINCLLDFFLKLPQ